MQDDGYFLARVLIALFGKKRVKFVYPVFIGIIIIVLVVNLLRAQDMLEIIFLVIALFIIFSFVLADALRMLRRNSVLNLQLDEIDYKSERDQVVETQIEDKARSKAVHINPKLPSSHGFHLLGGLISVMLMFPMMCIGYFAISMRAYDGDPGTALGFATVLLITYCVISPFAGLIGGITTGLAVRSARKYSSKASTTIPLLVTSITVALLAGLVGVAIQYYFICLEGQVCS